MTFSVSVAGAVVSEDGRLLAIRRRDNGRWELPGGQLEPGEAIHDGLRREVEEETGCVVEPGRLTGVYQNKTLEVVALVFRCELVGGHPGPTEESSEVAWLTPEQIGMQMTEAFAVRLLDALEPGPPPVRMHDGCQLL